MPTPLAPIAALAPSTSPPAAAPAAPDGADGAGSFAHALGQAGGHPHENGAAGRDAAQPATPARRADAADGTAPGSAHAAATPAAQGASRAGAARGPRGTAPADVELPHAQRAAGHEAGSADCTAAELPSTAAQGTDTDAASTPTEAVPQDLAAWLATLPLARPAAPEAGSPPGPAPLARAVTATAAAAARSTHTADARFSAADAAAPDTGGERLPPASGAAPAHAQAATRVLPETAAGRGLRSTDEASAAAAALPAAAAAAAAEKEAAANAQRSAELAAPLAALAAAAPGEAPRGAVSTPARQAEVHAAVGSEDFAPALGTQLRVMVRDGIEHARLKLNPADLGPIEVRIDLQGAQAQVDFSAAHAATRQALQEAVPALAGALRESGLTLTGGGVFDQPREQRGQAHHEGARPGSASSAGTGGTLREAPAALPARWSRARGAVDLYA